MQFSSKYVRRGITDIRSHTDLLCTVILFVGWTLCVASSASMIIGCDHCQLGVLLFRFHIVLTNCLLFGVRSSYLSQNVSDPTPLRMRRQSCGAPDARLIYNFVVVWVLLEQRLFARMALRHDCYV